MRLVTFACGGRLWGMQASEVRSVLPAESPAPIQGLPAFLTGVVTIRGSLVPVVDVQVLLDGEPTTVGSESCLIVVGIAESEVALVVSVLGPSLLVDSDRIDPSPRIGGEAAAGHIASVVRVEDELCLVLDLEALLADHGGALAKCWEAGDEESDDDRAQRLAA